MLTAGGYVCLQAIFVGRRYRSKYRSGLKLLEGELQMYTYLCLGQLIMRMKMQVRINEKSPRYG